VSKYKPAHDRDTLDQQTLNRAYARWAPIYDIVFGGVFDRGRKASIEAAEQVGGRILDVGIGTGISLLDFSPGNQIVGVDISEPMLRRARQRAVEAGLKNVACLAVMDAEQLGFTDAYFDVLVAQYVITAVPNPDAVLTEFARVTKPGGEIILVNHIGAERGPRRLFERCFAPIARGLGWRPEFPFARIMRWCERSPDVHLIERRPMPPLGHFSLIRLRKRA
jgi:phosphatidylethanolamine/phosphatidyl-N-methylethanolamine N-methyltransferase